MNWSESLAVAMEGLSANKSRSVLTMLGVIIGVGSVIAMLAIAKGTQEQSLARIQQMGTNVLIIFSGQTSQGGVRGGFGSVQSLTLDDTTAIPRMCPSVLKSTAEVSRNLQVVYRNQNTSTTVMGTTPAYLDVRNYSVEQGRFFTDKELRSFATVCCIGKTTTTNVFGNVNPVGKYILIAGRRFHIIGMMAEKGAAGGFGDPDDQIFVPITTAMYNMFGLTYVRDINVEARSMDLIDQASKEIESALRKRHRLRDKDDDDFIIRNQADIINAVNDSTKIFAVLLGSIASISLLVGGIGIMNIMLVSVTERTREIGIRIALGARQGDIQAQFLVEAIVLSLVGGAIGIVLGLLSSWILGMTTGWSVSVSPFSVMLSFGFSAFVGLAFGYFPARKASKLDPIDALRYE